MELYVHEFPTLPLKTLEDIRSRFSNRREWRDFVAAVQCTVNYSTVRHLHSATMFFNSAWARASQHLKQALIAPGAYTRCSGYRAGIPPA
jgi:hypothetical protein